MTKLNIYLIGSMRNANVPKLANRLRRHGFEVFDDWHASGPKSDDYWQQYERARGRSYIDAMKGVHAQNVFELDKRHLNACDVAVMVAPTGKSGHLELGYKVGTGGIGFIFMDGEPKRYDIMYGFATEIFFKEADLVKSLTVLAGRKWLKHH